MCLEQEYKRFEDDNSEIIGYAVCLYSELVKKFLSVYYNEAHENYIYYELNKEYEAVYYSSCHSIRRTPQPGDYYGFHGFDTLEEAKEYKDKCNLNYAVIVKCKFRSIIAEGYQHIFHVNNNNTGRDYMIPAFRAKFRTILEKVEE